MSSLFVSGPDRYLLPVGEPLLCLADTFCKALDDGGLDADEGFSADVGLEIEGTVGPNGGFGEFGDFATDCGRGFNVVGGFGADGGRGFKVGGLVDADRGFAADGGRDCDPVKGFGTDGGRGFKVGGGG